MPARQYKTAAIQQSNSDGWRTPDWLFQQLHREFNFEMDLCADDHNHKCRLYYTLQTDALAPHNQWDKAAWGNIPYSKPKPFVIKASEQAQLHRVPIVLMVKADTSTRWWAEYALKANEIRFLTGRMKFWDENNQPHYTAKWGSAFLIFDPELYQDDCFVSWWSYQEGKEPTRLTEFRR